MKPLFTIHAGEYLVGEAIRVDKITVVDEHVDNVCRPRRDGEVELPLFAGGEGRCTLRVNASGTARPQRDEGSQFGIVGPGEQTHSTPAGTGGIVVARKVRQRQTEYGAIGAV